MGTVIILSGIILAVIFTLKSSLKHYKGESGCCGGGKTSKHLKK